jgi:hypothetical protein
MKNILFAALVIALGVSASARAQSVESRNVEAARTLQSLPDLVNEKNHRTLGFEKVDEVRSAKLGDAIPVFMVRLDQLKLYKGGDASRLLVDLQTFIYPVQVDGQVRSTVEVRAESGRWEQARIGGAQRIRALDKNRRAAVKSTGMADSDFFEVRVPALNMVFLGHHDADGLKLTPLLDDAANEMKAGKTEAAEKVLARLVPLAQQTPERMP